jgi:hypothetical protein
MKECRFVMMATGQCLDESGARVNCSIGQGMRTACSNEDNERQSRQDKASRRHDSQQTTSRRAVKGATVDERLSRYRGCRRRDVMISGWRLRRDWRSDCSRPEEKGAAWQIGRDDTRPGLAEGGPLQTDEPAA